MGQNSFRTIKKYKLRHDVARYLSKASESDNLREYEKHKRRLKDICFSDLEYYMAIKCLDEGMKV